MPNDPPAKADYVEVIVLDALTRRKRFANQARADARHFVSGHASAHSAATDGDAPLHAANRNGARQRNDKIRIIIIRPGHRIPKINDLPTRRTQHSSQMRLELKSAMIGGNSNQPGLLTRCGFGVRHGAIYGPRPWPSFSVVAEYFP